MAQHTADQPTQLIVGDDLLDFAARDLPDRDTRCGIGQSINLSIAIRDHHDIVGFATIQTAFGQGLQRPDSSRIPQNT